jgi:hypothetical protein
VAPIASSVYKTPGVYVEDVPSSVHTITGVGTSTAAFVGTAPDADAYVNQPKYIENWGSFERLYAVKNRIPTELALAVSGFFANSNGGGRCYIVNDGGNGLGGGGGAPGKRQGLDVLEELDDVQLICTPGYRGAAASDATLTHCEKMKDRFAILDGPPKIETLATLRRGAKAPAPARPAEGEKGAAPTPSLGDVQRPRDSKYGAFYFPWLQMKNPFKVKGDDQPDTVSVPPCGHVAGLYARVDGSRGVHKTPANETLVNAIDLACNVTPGEQGTLNESGINIIRNVDGNIKVMGGRTLYADGDENKYLSVMRTKIMVAQSILRGTNWVVFEPNDYSLWKKIVRNLRDFLGTLLDAGVFRGKTPEEAFFVKCDEENNPPATVAQGFVFIDVGLAIVTPAEFIVFRIGQHSDSAEAGEV